MDKKPNPGPKGPRGVRSKEARAKRAQRPAYIRHCASAQIAKAHAELDKRKAQVDTLEGRIVRQSKAFRAEAAKFREAQAQVIIARATQSHDPDTPVCLWRVRLLTSFLLEQVPSNIQHQSYLTGLVARGLEKLECQMDNSRYSAGKLIDTIPAIHATVAALKDAKGPAATDIERVLKWQLGELGGQLLQDKVAHAELTKAVAGEKRAPCTRGVNKSRGLWGSYARSPE